MYTHSTYWTGEFAYGMVPQLREAQSRLGFDEGTFQNMLMNIRWVHCSRHPSHMGACSWEDLSWRCTDSCSLKRRFDHGRTGVGVQRPTCHARCPPPAARATWCRMRCR